MIDVIIIGDCENSHEILLLLKEAGMITTNTTSTGNNCSSTSDTTAGTRIIVDEYYDDYIEHEYDVSRSESIWYDIKEFIRFENMIACQWILKELVNWIMPIDPILKRSRKNNRMMFCKRNIGKYSLIEILVFILLWK